MNTTSRPKLTTTMTETRSIASVRVLLVDDGLITDAVGSVEDLGEIDQEVERVEDMGGV